MTVFSGYELSSLSNLMHGMEESEFVAAEYTKFNNSKTILLRLVFKDSEDFRHTLSNVIDDLNSVEYSLKIASDEVISLLSLHKVRKVCGYRTLGVRDSRSQGLSAHSNAQSRQWSHRHEGSLQSVRLAAIL